MWFIKALDISSLNYAKCIQSLGLHGTCWLLEMEVSQPVVHFKYICVSSKHLILSYSLKPLLFWPEMLQCCDP